jgi:hypothetical protein
MLSNELIADKLSTLLKTWDKVNQEWWVNAVQHSFTQVDSFTLMGRITTTGKDETFYAHEMVGA